MGNSVYSTPIAVGDTLYIANKSHLFAIREGAGRRRERHGTPCPPSRRVFHRPREPAAGRRRGARVAGRPRAKGRADHGLRRLDHPGRPLGGRPRGLDGGAGSHGRRDQRRVCRARPSRGSPRSGTPGGSFPGPISSSGSTACSRVTRPDLVLACYGMNCGIYLPLDEGRFAKFKDGMRAAPRDGREDRGEDHPPHAAGLRQAAGQAGAGRRRRLRRGARGLLRVAALEAGRRLDGDRHARADEGGARDATGARTHGLTFTPDAVHPNDDGPLGDLPGGDRAASATRPRRRRRRLRSSRHFLPEVTQRMTLLRDAYLAAAGHSAPASPPGLPIGEAEAKARRITESIRSRRLQLLRHEAPERRVADGDRVAAAAGRRSRARPRPTPAAGSGRCDRALRRQGHSTPGRAARTGRSPTASPPSASGTIRTKQGFGDCQLHVEFRTPTPATGNGQGRGNSGVFLMGRYEIQVLDSFEDGTDGPLDLSRRPVRRPLQAAAAGGERLPAARRVADLRHPVHTAAVRRRRLARRSRAA